MTRKHFVALARAIKRIEDTETRHIVAREAAKVCAESNPAFQFAKFMAACGLPIVIRADLV